ncbi:MAG: Oxygen-independent coproporphyrinogen III oxidase [Phycisphaerae bacterium]|nr:Oxygen-independent coproporphyrinogen III oxidase [Phycisphaerae bacterium]
MPDLPIQPRRPQPTEVGTYFVSNYPPFSAWKPEFADEAQRAVRQPPAPDTPLGLYLHIPFCRKRCKFCYFRVYTDKNASDVETYLDALTREIELYSRLPVMKRPFRFAYFGGGTPSFLSAQQLASLVARLRRYISWDDAEEVTFECEPGTLQRHKLAAIREMGVTRLSLGIENFNDAILEENGRAHLSAEVYRAYDWAREIGFPQINVDLIAGMVGETSANWSDCLTRTIALQPDSVTIYQMELPYNTVISKGILAGGESPVASWDQKRAWVREAFDRLIAAGYEISSAYTLTRPSDRSRFVYRDSLWHGADMLGTGVASFSHVAGLHYQNVDQFDDYVARLRDGRLPVQRALRMTPEERLVRELVLQLKLGRVDAGYFRQKFDVELKSVFAETLSRHTADGWLTVEGDAIRLTRDGLLRADALLPAFFHPQHRVARYT